MLMKLSLVTCILLLVFVSPANGCESSSLKQGVLHGLQTVEGLLSQAEYAKEGQRVQVIGVLNKLDGQSENEFVYLLPEKSWLQINQYEQIAALTVHLFSTIRAERPRIRSECMGKFVKVTGDIGQRGGFLGLNKIWSISLLETQSHRKVECLTNSIEPTE